MTLHIHTQIYVYIYMFISVSMSICMYIYIYIQSKPCNPIERFCTRPRARASDPGFTSGRGTVERSRGRMTLG